MWHSGAEGEGRQAGSQPDGILILGGEAASRAAFNVGVGSKGGQLGGLVVGQLLK